MKLMVLTVLTVSLMSSPGCSKKGGNVADPCETSIGAAIDAMLGARKEGAPPQMIEISNKLRTVMISRCKADSWPAEALDCYRAATDQPGIRKCRERLPPEKAQRLQGEILKVMSGAGRPGGFRGGQGGPPPGMGGPHGGMGPPAGGPPAGDPPASAGSTTPE